VHGTRLEFFTLVKLRASQFERKRVETGFMVCLLFNDAQKDSTSIKKLLFTSGNIRPVMYVLLGLLKERNFNNIGRSCLQTLCSCIRNVMPRGKTT